MPKVCHNVRIVAVAFASFVINVLPAQDAGDPTDPVFAYNTAVKEIQQQEWEKGIQTVDAVIAEHAEHAEHAEGALKRFGPVFGHFYFLKGILLQGKGDPSGAATAFKTCYETYNNKVLEDMSQEEKATLKRNLFVNASLMQWANSEMKAERYAEARDLYEKVLVEGKKDDKVNLVHVGVNLGRCYLKSGQLEKGYDFMTRPLANENLSDGLRETIFMVVAEDWSPEVGFPEVRAFLDKYSKVVDADPFEERYERNPRFQYLAQYALQESDPVRALAWYERIVNPELLIPDYKKRYTSLENREVADALKERKQEALDELRGQIDQIGADFISILNGVGSAHFIVQNFAGSYVAFSQLADRAGKKHEERPIFLHNAVLSASQVGLLKNAYRYGREFLDEFPEHELRPAVARVMVDSLLVREEYEDAYSISGEVREGMGDGDSIREVPDFVRGVSAFHLGKIEEAEMELAAYNANYPKGERKELVQFFEGLTKVRLAKWEDAALLFNSFIENYPGSSMVATALFQCAMSEFMIEQPDAALAKVERIHEEFPSEEVVPSAWNLKGDIFAAGERAFGEIEASYLRGRETGLSMDQPETVAYALWQLVIQTAENEQWEKTQQHFDEFQANYPDSEFRYDVLAAALPMLVHQERADEAKEQLREIVWIHRDQPDSTVLAEMFGTYVEFLKENYETEVAITELAELRMRRGISPALVGWLTIAQAEILEAGEADQDEINKLYYQLEAGFKPEEHSNYPIVQLARWITNVRKKPEEAMPLYDFILTNREGTANYDYSLVDMAEIQANSEDSAQREEAMEKFRRVLAEVPNEELQERSVLGMARIRAEERNFEAALPLWEQYLENRNWTLSRPEANYSMAYAYEQQGNLSDALKIYVSVYANFPGYLDWSTRAYLRTAAIIKSRGEDLKALKVLQDMLKRMGHHDHPGVEKGKELFLKWRSEYTPEPSEKNG